MAATQKQLDAMARSNRESNFLTREAIKDALYVLLEEVPYQDIRITDIVKKAGVSRSAFYHNYKTKGDVLTESLRDTQDEIFSFKGDILKTNWETLLTSIKDHEKETRIIIDAGLENFLLMNINEYSHFGTVDYYTAMWNGMIFNVILYYAKNGFVDPKEAAASVDDAMHALADLVSSQK